VAFAPDSKTLGLCQMATAFGFRTADNAVQLWDVATGDRLAGFKARGVVNTIAFSPDGRLLAAAPWVSLFPIPIVLDPYADPGNLVHIWDRQSGQALKLSASYRFWVRGLAFSPDSIRMAVANYKHISLLDVRERQEVHRFICHALAYWPSYSSDGKFIAAADRHGRVYVWDVDTGKDHMATPFRTWCRDSVVFSPVVDLVAATDDYRTVSFLDARTGLAVKKTSFPEGAPCPFFFTPDGEAIVGGGMETNPVVHMWDASTGNELHRWDLTAILDREGL